MIILLQSVATQFRMLFWRISYCKVQQSNFIRKYDRLLLQSASKVWQTLLQSVSDITKSDTKSH